MGPTIFMLHDTHIVYVHIRVPIFRNGDGVIPEFEIVNHLDFLLPQDFLSARPLPPVYFFPFYGS
jgi:hypothetical protein